MIRYIIIEDEESISDFLLSNIKGLRPDWINLKQLTSVKDTVNWLQENNDFDIAFMDIQLNDGISFEVFEQVEVTNMIIFTTAYDKYAIKAFEVNSIDYLLKPITTNRLLKAIEKFEFQHKQKSSEKNDYQNLISLLKKDAVSYRDKFLVQSTTAYYSIFSEQVAYFYIVNKVLNAVTSDKKEHIIDFSMDNLEAELDPTMFFRVNRSTIVNVNFIHKFENYFSGKLIVKLIPPFDTSISVSRSRASDFKIWMGK